MGERAEVGAGGADGGWRWLAMWGGSAWLQRSPEKWVRKLSCTLESAPHPCTPRFWGQDLCENPLRFSFSPARVLPSQL